MYNQETTEFTIYKLFLAALLSFFAGFSFRSGLVCKSNPVENCDGRSDEYAKDQLGQQSARVDNFEAFEKEYACNARLAYEELTRLHKNKNILINKVAKGEANRARTATIQRKADAATSGELAFRHCVGAMVPELLAAWDNDVKKPGFGRGWHEESEAKLSEGISIAELEKAADSLER